MIMKIIKDVLKDNWPILVIFLVTITVIRIFYLRNHRERFRLYKEILTVGSIIYIFLLFQLLTKVELNNGSGYNLIPFTEIMRYKFGSKLFIMNVLGNIILFIPFGLIVAEYIKPKSILAPLFTSLIVSCTVEFVQLNIGRSFDIDDIILNIIGSIIGYLIYVGLRAINRRLPSAFHSDWLYNIICLVLIVIFVLYILKSFGVLAI